jgi:phosphonate transport system permease protein
VKYALAFAAIGGVGSFYYLNIPWAYLFTSSINGLQGPTTLGFSFPFAGRATLLMLQTVLMAWAATILASIVAFLAAPLSTNALIGRSYLQDSYRRRGWSSVARRSGVIVTKLVLQVTRAMPELTLALLFVLWVGPGALAGILAIAVHNVGVIARLYTDVYEDVEPRPPRALEASGSGPSSIWLFGVLPQVVSRLAAFTLYRFEVNLRATITVGFVGAGGAGDALNNAIALFHISDLAVLLAVMLAFVTTIDYAGDRLRRRILRGPAVSALRFRRSVDPPVEAPHDLEFYAVSALMSADHFKQGDGTNESSVQFSKAATLDCGPGISHDARSFSTSPGNQVDRNTG